MSLTMTPRPAGPPAIVARGIRKSFQGKVVLDGIDLTVGSGEMLGLLGPNGAGKTTLIKILCGLLVPDAGAAQVLGCDLLRQAARIRGQVSLVAPTADVGIDNNMTVWQNLDFWALVYGLRGREKDRRIDEVLEMVDLADAHDAWPMHISAGMRQRLAIARALLARNPLLFLDEPTIKLDVEGARRIRRFIRQINREVGLTVVVTTHLMFEAEELCPRVVVMDGGRIIADGTPAELKARLGRNGRVEAVVAGLDAVALGSLGYDWRQVEDGALIEVSTPTVEAETSRLLDAVSALGGRVRSLRTSDVTLEDAFFALTGGSLAGRRDGGI